MAVSIDQGLRHIGLALLALLLIAQTPPVQAQNLDRDSDELLYTVRPGDTLIAIADKYLLRRADHIAVQRLNAIGNDRRLAIGSQLRLPTALLKSRPIPAEVISFRGDVTLLSGKTVERASIGAPVREAMIIQTGRDGFMTFRTASGARYTLPSMTRIRINRLRIYLLSSGSDIEVELLTGRVEVGAPVQRDDRSRFRVRTPVAVSAVRGTTFRIGYDGAAAKTAASLTEVIEGSVAVASQATAANDLLPAGFGAAVQPDGAVQRAQLLPAPAFVDGSARQVDAALRFTVARVKSAVGYRVQIARDAGFGDMVADAQASDLSLDLPNLADGTYFVRANAIADSGLEGLTTTQRFERLRFALSTRRVPDAATPAAIEFLWDVQRPELPPFRFQLFAANDPATPIIDEIGLTREELTVSGLKPGNYRWRIQLMGMGPTAAPDQSWSPFAALLVE